MTRQADWSFSKGVSGGNAGKLIASGTSPATANVLNCTKGVDLFCLGILGKGLHVTLKAGKYWLTVVPYCTNQNDCASARYFLADEEDDPKPLNHVGPKNILDASYVTAKDFGLFYTPGAHPGRAVASVATCSRRACWENLPPTVLSSGLLPQSRKCEAALHSP